MHAVQPETPLDISVIVPLMRDRGFGIRGLESWTRGQTFRRDRLQVIALSDTSDANRERAALQFLLPQDRLLRVEGATETQLLDHGARNASGRVLLFTEGHCKADPACVAEVLSAIDSGIDAVSCRSIGDYTSTIGWLENQIFAEGLETWSRDGDPRMVSLRGFAVSREAYLTAGGLRAEDHECFAERTLAERLSEQGLKFGLAPNAVVRHRQNHAFPGLKHDSDAFFECEFATRASGVADSHLAFSLVWDQRGNYDRELARAALRAALKRPANLLRDLPMIASRAAAGPRLAMVANDAAMRWFQFQLMLGAPFERVVRRHYQRHWNRMADGSGLLALAKRRDPPSQVSFPGRLSIADIGGDRLFAFNLGERDGEGRVLRRAHKAFAMRLPIPAGRAYDFTIETLSPTAFDYLPSVVIDGSAVPSNRISVDHNHIVAHLAPLGPSPCDERLIGIVASGTDGTSKDIRSRGVAVFSIQTEAAS